MNIYRTSNLNLMAYFHHKGLKRVGFEIENEHNRTRIMAKFEDPDNIAPQLVLEWNDAPEKKFREWWLYYRNAIDEEMKRGS